MLNPTLHEIILFVRDLDAARGFYSDLLGFPIVYESDWFLTFRSGEGVHISCNGRREDHKTHGARGRGVLIDLRVADVDATWRALSDQGVPFDFPPEDKPWGLRSCGMRDPEGHSLWVSSLLPGAR